MHATKRQQRNKTERLPQDKTDNWPDKSYPHQQKLQKYRQNYFKTKNEI